MNQRDAKTHIGGGKRQGDLFGFSLNHSLHSERSPLNHRYGYALARALSACIDRLTEIPKPL